MCFGQKLINPALCFAGCLKKGARLELSLVHQLFNLGNNKNIKWIPVSLCYNRSTTEWKRRDSETKPMTSERNKRVEEEEEEEGTNRWAGKWQERPSEQARGRDRCPCKVKEGSREDGGVRSSCRGKQERSQRSLVGIQMRLNSQQNNPPNPLHLKASRKERKALKVFALIFRGGSDPFIWIWRASSPNLDGHGYRKPSNRQHKIPMLKVGWLLNLYDDPAILN